MTIKLKVEGYTNLVRDIETKAIVNNNITDYQVYMNRIKSREKQGDQIRNTIKEINILKQELFEIKELLKEVIKK